MPRLSPLPLRLRLVLPFLASLCAASGFSVAAQVTVAPPPTVGSSNPVSPEPLVTRPSTTPCKVQLFQNAKFDGSGNVTYSYTPPAACPGPWAKVVFSADFTVTVGSQLDRNAAVYLGNATLFRGTTVEPQTNPGPSWHVESDATDFSALLNTAQTGVAAVAAVVNSQYTALIYATAELDFYPVSAAYPAAVVPDQVVPMVPDATNPNQSFTSASPLTLAVTLPRNITQLYLDLISQPDAYWYLSTPNALAAPYINNVDATALRELDVTIDGTPAGVAPNHPYITAGGLDPSLWEPIPGAQALNLKPYRINLTPFAGALSDGNPHTIVINDIHTIGSAYLNADLFIYTDHGGSATTGSVVSNTLTASPGTSVTQSVYLDGNGYGTAEVSESLKRSFSISGYTNTSSGKVTTTVSETVSFSNAQQLTNSATQNVVMDSLTSTVDSTETTTSTSGTTARSYHTENPLQVSLNTFKNQDGSYTKLTTAEVSDIYSVSGPGSFTSNAREDVMSTDEANFINGAPLDTSGQASTGTYTSTDSDGNNYSSTLTAANNVLTGVATKSSSSAATLFLTSTASTAAQGSPITFTAKVIPANSSSTPTGYVTFYSNGNVFSVIGTSTGTATVTDAFLPVGTDAITATYTGDANFEAESSVNAVSVTITAVAPALTIGALSPAALTLSQGQSAVVSLPVTGNATFSGTVAFTCTGAPSETSCKVNPASVALAVSNNAATETATVSVLVATTAPNASTVAHSRWPGLASSLGGISVAGLALLCLPRRRGSRWNSLTMLALLALGIASASTLSGCAGKGNTTPTSSIPGTPIGSYTMTVTATSGTITHSATFMVTVTK